jgi:hypothetical protein
MGLRIMLSIPPGENVVDGALYVASLPQQGVAVVLRKLLALNHQMGGAYFTVVEGSNNINLWIRRPVGDLAGLRHLLDTLARAVFQVVMPFLRELDTLSTASNPPTSV